MKAFAFRILPFTAILGAALLAAPAFAQPVPKSYADCDALYEREFKKAAAKTGKDLRESQRLAGLQRIRCNRAIEQKTIIERGKGAKRRGG